MARPRAKIDIEQVKKLAAIQCSYAQMAAVLGCNESTLTRRFAQAIKEGREQGFTSLKRKQFEVAMSGHVTMLIWLGKQYLGQTDKIEERTILTVTDAKAVEALDKDLTDIYATKSNLSKR